MDLISQPQLPPLSKAPAAGNYALRQLRATYMQQQKYERMGVFCIGMLVWQDFWGTGALAGADPEAAWAANRRCFRLMALLLFEVGMIWPSGAPRASSGRGRSPCSNCRLAYLTGLSELQAHPNLHSPV